MRVNIGIDFGSTNSAFAYYDKSARELKNYTLENNSSASIPSTVTVSERRNSWLYGNAAREVIGNRGQRVFEHFKMLLAEKNQRLVHSRGYDEKYTPYGISQYYLHSVLSKIAERYHVQVQDIVVCIPENWTRRTGMYLDGRGLLKEILSTDTDGKPVSRKVRVVTEPEAASAYFAYDYEKHTRKSFSGHLLLIDYGGGTLDITLTAVTTNPDGTMNIRYIDGGGAGENHNTLRGNAIGEAGIAFMQDIVVRAMREQQYLSEDETVNYQDPAFKKAVKELESKLINQSTAVNQFFGQYGQYDYVADILETEPTWFTDLDYGEGLDISYQHIYASYRHVIEGVLAREIGKINEVVRERIHKDPCDMASFAQDDFKIALVGGFGNFILVQMQIFQIYNIDPDVPYSGMIANVEGTVKELAVSMGAALIAAGQVDLKRVARFSVGIRGFRNGNEPVNYYPIRYGECLEDGEIRYCMRSPGQYARFANIAGQESLLINNTAEDVGGVLMPMKRHMVERIRSQIAPLESDGRLHFWRMGFSMDDSGIISFHLVDANDSSIRISIVLARYSELFEQNVDVTEDSF